MARRASYLTLVSVLLLSLLLPATAVLAVDDDSSDPEIPGTIYDVHVPWLPHGVSVGHDSEFYGSIVIQNLEPAPIHAEVLVGVGAERSENGDPSDWALRRTLSLAPYASTTLDAVDLHIPQGVGASVKVSAVLADSSLLGSIVELADISVPARIAAVVKNAGPVVGSNAVTTVHHNTVDGYSGLTRSQVESATGTHVLPIVQNNSGWETIIRLAHMGDFQQFGDAEANVAVTLYEAGSNSAGVAAPQVDVSIRPGAVTSLTLSDIVGNTEWVGSAVIVADVPLGAIAERVKHSDSMLVTVVSRPEQLNNGSQYAPLVFRNYNDWNTGISIANTNAAQENHVTVTYFGPNMEEAGQDTITIPPRGMNFIHSPGGQDGAVQEGFVGSARIVGTTSFHAVVDQVKYGDGGGEVGQAMSYVLEPAASTFIPKPISYADRLWSDLPGARVGSMLALPLVQRGNPEATGGDMTGIQLFNTSSERSVQLEIIFYDHFGTPVAPTDSRGSRNPMLVTLGANQSYTLYTPSIADMPSGFQGSAVIEVVGGGGGVVGISNNVNYDVTGDGSAAYSLTALPPAWDLYDAILCAIAGDCRVKIDD